MIFRTTSWLSAYREKLSRRDERVANFSRRFLVSRAFKTLVLFPTLPILLMLFVFKPRATILYRPDPRHVQLMDGLSSVLVIGRWSDRVWTRQYGYAFFPFYPIYVLCNLGCSVVWTWLIKKIEPKRILVWTDYGLDQYLAIMVSNHYKVKVWCLQHGLFPFQNNKDLDGLDAHVNVVCSIFQKDILRRAGFVGKVILCEELFGDRTKQTTKEDVEAWEQSNNPIVFVGAGYSHDDDAESRIVRLMVELSMVVAGKYKLIYRPHPRDHMILKKLELANISCISGTESAYESKGNLVFVGVKSTYLLEAQNAGRIVILITGAEFPRYFESGEIRREINYKQLDSIDDLLVKQAAFIQAS